MPSRKTNREDSMNSFIKRTRIKKSRILGTVVILLFLTCISPVHANSPGHHSNNHFTQDRQADQERAARKAVLSSATLLLKKTPAGQEVDRFRQKFVDKYRFEFKKQFPDENPALQENQRSEEPETPVPEEFSFSGTMNEAMRPSLEFFSRSRPATICLQFDLLDQKLDFEISNPVVNRFLDKKTVLELSSDGSSSQAVLGIFFEF